MSADSIAGRYARALLDIAVDQKKAEAFGKELQAWIDTFASSSDLRVVLTNPGIPKAERQSVVVAVLAKLKLDQMVHNFVRLLVDRGRVGMSSQIGEAYQMLADQMAGRVRGTAKSAVSMTGAQISKLTKAISKLTESEVVLETEIDESVLGGVRVEIGGRVFDGSVRGELDRIREQLTS